jgi:hypothetical protein
MFVNFFDEIVIDTEDIQSVKLNNCVNEYFEVKIYLKNSKCETILIYDHKFKTKKDLYDHVAKLLNKGIKGSKDTKLNKKISKEVFEQIKDIKELIKDAKSY